MTGLADVISAIHADPTDYDKPMAALTIEAALRERVPDIISDVRWQKVRCEVGQRGD